MSSNSTNSPVPGADKREFREELIRQLYVILYAQDANGEVSSEAIDWRRVRQLIQIERARRSANHALLQEQNKLLEARIDDLERQLKDRDGAILDDSLLVEDDSESQPTTRASIKSILSALSRKWWHIALVVMVVLCAAVFIGYLFSLPPQTDSIMNTPEVITMEEAAQEAINDALLQRDEAVDATMPDHGIPAAQDEGASIVRLGETVDAEMPDQDPPPAQGEDASITDDAGLTAQDSGDQEETSPPEEVSTDPVENFTEPVKAPERFTSDAEVQAWLKRLGRKGPDKDVEICVGSECYRSVGTVELRGYGPCAMARDGQFKPDGWENVECETLKRFTFTINGKYHKGHPVTGFVSTDYIPPPSEE